MTAWFEPLYASAAAGTAEVPWDRDGPNSRFVAWADSVALVGAGRSALVVGCGYGRDAEYLARLGFEVSAFDIAPSAIEGARARNARSPVSYEVADLLDLPAAWAGAFEFVLESHNVQALPDPLRARAIGAVGSLVAPGGTLVVCAAGRRDDALDPDGPPWPLLRREVEAFGVDGLELRELDEDVDTEGILRWRAVLGRP